MGEGRMAVRLELHLEGMEEMEDKAAGALAVVQILELQGVEERVVRELGNMAVEAVVQEKIRGE